MNIEVHHADEPTFRTSEACSFPKGFTLVARLEVDTPHGSPSEQHATALDVAFQRTNHIDAGWHEAPGIECLVTRPRSTSVGDVVVVDGLASLCMSAGWTTLPTEAA
jgi:hypothetical protein